MGKVCTGMGEEGSEEFLHQDFAGEVAEVFSSVDDEGVGGGEYWVWV